MKAGRAGTSTRRSTTGRTRGRSAGATCRSGGGWWPAARGPVLELGCGTGRISLPLARGGVDAGRHRSVGADARAGARRAARRGRRAGRRRGRLSLVRGDIRALPFADARFGVVIAAYGILQSLLRERDLGRPSSRSHGCWSPAGCFGVDLVPDVPHWREYDEPRSAARPRARRRASHPDRVGPAGSEAPADDVRAALRGAARP